MTHAQLEKLLSGGDLRSLGKTSSLVETIKKPEAFDALFRFLFHAERIKAMRAADAVEKITREDNGVLQKHKKAVLALADRVRDKEVKWHLALLMPRLRFNEREFITVWDKLSRWANDNNESRIVRVNAIQALFEMTRQRKEMSDALTLILLELDEQEIPSLRARIKNIRKQLEKS